MKLKYWIDQLGSRGQCLRWCTAFGLSRITSSPMSARMETRRLGVEERGERSPKCFKTQGLLHSVLWLGTALPGLMITTLLPLENKGGIASMSQDRHITLRALSFQACYFGQKFFAEHFKLNYMLLFLCRAINPTISLWWSQVP